MADDTKDARPVQLHVIHDLGGGSAKWLEDFVRADTRNVNLVLRSFSHDEASGGGLALYTHPGEEVPSRVWKLASPIHGAAASHPEYRAALEELLAGQRVGTMLVSSLIGHSLDALDTGLPTVVVMHDYFPYCPSINLHFDGVCRKCDARRISDCHRVNARFNAFPHFLPEDRVRVRERYMELVRAPNVVLAAPSRSVADNLMRLDERFGEVSLTTIAHGYGQPLERLPVAEPGGERLRILVLGQLSEAKGSELLDDALGELRGFADVYLIGPREVGEQFQYEPHVHVLSHYEIEELPVHVANINPHVGLLMSIVPETFSYALSELMMLGVPVAATRVGSFAERIRHLQTGYLFEPDASSLLRLMRSIDADRDTLARIRHEIRAWRPRTAEEMVADYRRAISAAAAHAPRRVAHQLPVAGAGASGWLAGGATAEAATIAGMWKQIRQLNLQLTVVNDARREAELRRLRDAREHEELLERLAEAQAGLAQKDALANELGNVAAQLGVRNAQLAEVYSSTSWRISAPVRWVGVAMRKARVLAHCIVIALREPAGWQDLSARLARAWRLGGLHEVKKVLVALQAAGTPHDLWGQYRESFRGKVRPRVVEQVRKMAVRPLVSVIVPTFNTPEPMLRQMLDSVLAQLYPEWELCVADDGSSEPHVEKVLRHYASKEPRIKLDLGRENRGVSHASNRALEMATGEFVVLLDHDDILEEQALFRVAESVAEDSPDMLYSDEVLTTPDGADIRRYVFRPAFSPDYLRAHPYIVHLAGFRTRLLRKIGGFDESLSISQDYDLILRASEKARTIVHIPEILYQWRFHGASAGHRKMGEVMEISKSVLRRHLERCGEAGAVNDGASFNFFDVRYPLVAGLKVAIIIPTKNLRDLLRQCIESIRATVKDVAYDILVVDHESDDPQTREYLASIAGEVRVLPYAGGFNFSAINNFAVRHLGPGYSHYLFCNNDIEAVAPGWLERMLELGQRPAVGIVGALLFYPDRKTIQHAGVCVGLYRAAEHYGKWVRLPGDPVGNGYEELLRIPHEVSAVTAACMLMRADAFDAVGGFDESIAVGFGDVDICLRAGERGYRVIFTPYAKLVHHESYTRGTSAGDSHPEDTSRFRLKWARFLQEGDPYYSPSLSPTSTQWEVRRPLPCSFEIQRRVTRKAS